MIEELNNISAEELFGRASRLVAQVGEGSISDIVSLGTMYQILTGIIALLFIYVSVRYFDIIIHLLLSSLSKRISRPDNHIYTAEIKNIKIITSAIGVALLSLLMMRLSVMQPLAKILTPILVLPPWAIGGLTLVGIVLVILCERVMLYIVGFVSGSQPFCNTIWHLKMLYFSTTVIIIAPLVILLLLSDGIVAEIAFWALFALYSISFVLFTKETFLLFHAQRFSIFHWILYLCALEIFPLSLFFAPIVRG